MRKILNSILCYLFPKSRLSRETELFMEAMPIGIVIADDNNNILYANAEALKMFGYSKEDIVGQKVESVIPERFRERHTTQSELYKLNPRPRQFDDSLNLYGLHKDGTEFPLEIYLNSVYTKDGLRIIACVRDITLRRKAQRIIEIERKNASLEETNKELEIFAYIAAHDLQDPLKQNTVYFNLIKKEVGDNIYLDKINANNLRMQTMIKSLLDFAKHGSESLKIVDVDMNALIRDMVTNILSIHRARFAVTHELPTIKCDRTQISRVLQNLISNAIKYKSDRPLEINISCQIAKNEFIFCVKDNGIGIPHDKIDTLFNLFKRVSRDDKGTGFGLAICKKIVEKHGGKIWVISEEGKGSKFYFSIPKES
jgi:PAS domain S-box-containing protein